MAEFYTFKFGNRQSNQRLISLLKKASIPFAIEQDGSIRYSSKFESIVENELIKKIRNSIIRPWQILSCPADWAGQYRLYMKAHNVKFSEEWIDHQLSFLIPRNARPHSWRLDSLEVKKAADSL